MAAGDWLLKTRQPAPSKTAVFISLLFVINLKLELVHHFSKHKAP